MDDDDNQYFAAYIDACMHCGEETVEKKDERETAKCLFCERYFQNHKLFLNNVG